MKRYALFILVALLWFGGLVIPLAVLDQFEVKEIGFFPFLGLIILIVPTLAGVFLGAGCVLFGIAHKKYAAPEGVIAWFNNQKKTLNRAAHHLGKTFGFLLMVGFALAVASATGWYDLFDPEKTTEEWPWYNFLALILGGVFSAYLIYHAIKFLGRRD